MVHTTVWNQWANLLRAVRWAAVLCSLFVVYPVIHLYAVMDEERPSASDPDYATGLDAFERHDWQGVIEAMTAVVARRPWDDKAYNLMGYAYRKLGDYEQSLMFYFKALDLNPHNRGALEYLGETYVALGCLEQAQATLSRLETACKRLVPTEAREQWQHHCEPWHDLDAAITTAHSRPPRPCRLPTTRTTPR